MKPAYTYSAVLDILGYKDGLGRDDSSGTLDFGIKLRNALSYLLNVNQCDFNYYAVSDTIIITCSEKGDIIDFLNIIKNVELNFLKERLFIRGGVAFAKHFASDFFTYSHAVARAHFLEQEVAIYPRVVIDNNVIEKLGRTIEYEKLRNAGILCEMNGTYFINILESDNWGDIYSYARDIYFGATLFNDSEIRDPRILWIKIKDPDSKDPLSSYLKSHFSPQILTKLEMLNNMDFSIESARNLLASELNRVLQGPCLLTEISFAKKKLRLNSIQKIKRLGKSCHLIKNNLLINRLLIESIYQKEIESKITFDNLNLLNWRENELMKHAWFEKYLFSAPYANKKLPQYIPKINYI